MPKTPSRGWWHQRFLWRVAEAGMLVQCRCTKCRRAQHYLASDLVEVFGRDLVVGKIWGRCPRCGSAEFWSEHERHPTSDDVGHLVVRRPDGVRQVQLWRDEFYGPTASSVAPQAGDS